LHQELRERARANRQVEISACRFSYVVFAVPVASPSAFFGFIEGGRVFNGSAGDPRLIEPLLRLLHRNRLVIDTVALRENFLATPVVPRQEMNLVVNLVKAIAERLAAEIATTVDRHGSASHPAVIKAMDYTRSHLSEPLAIPVVARAAGVSGDYFAKLFKRTTGLGYTDYVIQRRVVSAQEMLVSTGKNINEIAFATGFESISHFNRCFKAHARTTPKLYRSLHSLQNAAFVQTPAAVAIEQRPVAVSVSL
jgi:AraC-like DNA-binding protein